MKHLLLTSLCTASLFATSAYAGDRDLTPEKFVKKAAISNMFEIESSKLALEKTQNAQVKSFARQMIKDHQKAGDQLKKAVGEAKMQGAAIPTSLDEKHHKKLDKLKSKSGEEFDEAYVDIQEDAHDKAVRLFKHYSNDENQAGPIKTFAANTLPTLKQHEKRSDDLEDEIGNWWDWD